MNAAASGHNRNRSSRIWHRLAAETEFIDSECRTSMRLPEKQPLTLSQVLTSQLRHLAASSGLDSVNADRPALLKCLNTELSKEAKQQWVIQDAEVSTDTVMAMLLHDSQHKLSRTMSASLSSCSSHLSAADTRLKFKNVSFIYCLRQCQFSSHAGFSTRTHERLAGVLWQRPVSVWRDATHSIHICK
jgi:hypothetical protein